MLSVIESFLDVMYMIILNKKNKRPTPLIIILQLFIFSSLNVDYPVVLNRNKCMYVYSSNKIREVINHAILTTTSYYQARQ